MKKLIVYGPIAMALIASLAVGIPAAVSADTSDAVSTDTSATTTTDEQTPRQELISKIADDLGLDYDQVLAAFDKAQQELSNESLQQHLAQAVQDGIVTQDEANQITAWINAEPSAAENLGQGWLNSLIRPSSASAVNGNASVSTPPIMGGGFPGMAPSGNISDSGTASMSTPPAMSNGFPVMRPSGNTSDSQPANMDNMPGGNTLSTEEYIQNAVDNGTITQAEADEITAWINVMPDAMTKIGALQHNGHMGPSEMDLYAPPF